MKINIIAILQFMPVFFQLYLAIDFCLLFFNFCSTRFINFSTSSEIISIHDLLIVVISQNSDYHQTLTNDLIKNLNDQLDLKNAKLTKYNISSNYINDWTILPLLPKFSKVTNFSWILICEERTRVNLENLQNTLANYDSKQEIWFGQELYDEEPTIVHHYAFYENSTLFKYPNLASGFVLSKKLYNHLVDRYINELSDLKIDFSIDISHEFALFVWNKGNGVNFKHNHRFCIENSENCATYVLPFKKCNKLTNNNNIYYAIKTCKSFHKTRIPVIKSTWGKYIKKVGYFSDINDPSIPSFKQHTPNVKKGHCEKTKEILVHISKFTKEGEIQWVVIVDDDTIFSVAKLNEYLSCFNPSEKIALGQRYGYDVLKPNSEGFNYITGGGGVVLSKKAVEELVAFKACDCPSHTTPDDMYLFGVCLAQLNISIVHSPMFHQARPLDYAKKYLMTDKPISFHKHWMIDPVQVYEEWFAKDDLKWNMEINNNNQEHIEL